MIILTDKIEKIKNEAERYGAKLVVAAKYLTLDETRSLIDGGVNEIGETRVDSFVEKYDALSDKDVKWHFFGVVQSRRVRDLAGKIDCLHSLDRLSLAMEFDKRLSKPLDCFIEVNISEEPNRNGIPLSKVKTLVKSLSKCANIRIIGLMCVAKRTVDEDELTREFTKMRMMKEEIESMHLDYAPCHELSMGMSNDYKLALMNGSTLIRVGSKFFKN